MSATLRNYPKLGLVRLTFRRRIYTQAHCDVTVESIESVHENRENVRGLKMVHEPKSCASSRPDSRGSKRLPANEGYGLPVQ